MGGAAGRSLQSRISSGWDRVRESTGMSPKHGRRRGLVLAVWCPCTSDLEAPSWAYFPFSLLMSFVRKMCSCPGPHRPPPPSTGPPPPLPPPWCERPRLPLREQPAASRLSSVPRGHRCDAGLVTRPALPCDRGRGSWHLRAYLDPRNRRAGPREPFLWGQRLQGRRPGARLQVPGLAVARALGREAGARARSWALR